MEPKSGDRFSNRLIAESSPYLRQHADNPVEWYPWGEEALLRAKAEDKPILLSIGYSACHWCHVMAHESFESAEIARVMNQHFINVKVDREERPDLDEIYQKSVQVFTGRGGGWPLTMFLTPDQEPFYGGTYFPPVPRYSLPGFMDVLLGVVEAYRHHREEVAKNVERVKGGLLRVGVPQHTDESLTDRLLDGAAKAGLDALAQGLADATAGMLCNPFLKELSGINNEEEEKKLRGAEQLPVVLEVERAAAHSVSTYSSRAATSARSSACTFVWPVAIT